MEVVQTVTSIAEEASGPSYSVPALCAALEKAGAKVTLHVLGPAPESLCQRVRVVQHKRFGVVPRLAISREMAAALRNVASRVDIIHNNGLWEMTNVYPARAARRAGAPLVTSPRGTFAPWALNRSRRLKQVMWWACQGRAVRDSRCLHATAETEFEAIRAAGLQAPVAIIPNGIDLPELNGQPKSHNGPRRLLFLGRVHPVKGVDLLIRAWRNVQDRAPDWSLEIVGPDNGGHLARMRELAESIGARRLSFLGPAYESEKSAAYRRADLFVLPTHSENFGMAVAEALAHGVPAIVTKGAPWSGLESHGCGWWIDREEDVLTDSLLEALALDPDQLQQRGDRGRAWMECDFSWDRVGQMMFDTYRWILGGGAAPPWVRERG